MKRVVAHYVGHPLHVLVLLASLALSGFAALSLLGDQTVMVAVWFVGAAVVHDLVLLPLYTVLDRGLHRGGPRLPAPPWLNYVRFPAAISLLLLLVFLPEIARVSTVLPEVSGLTADPYLLRWLAVTGGLFLIAAVAYGVRMVRLARRTDPTLSTDEGDT